MINLIPVTILYRREVIETIAISQFYLKIIFGYTKVQKIFSFSNLPLAHNNSTGLEDIACIPVLEHLDTYSVYDYTDRRKYTSLVLGWCTG